jgi:hypothetical protein
MDAAADYSAAVRLLQAPLPAYVSYVERSYANAYSLSKDTTQTIEVRTRDGVVVKGDPSKIKVSEDGDVAVNPVTHPPFKAACYSARGVVLKHWSDRIVEAIALRDVCHTADEHETNFQELYVDPATHEPLAAVGDREDDHVSVLVEQRIARFDGHFMPAKVTVKIHGHGLVGFLNVTAGQEYSAYDFRTTP